jgi:hypothetical protein
MAILLPLVNHIKIIPYDKRYQQNYQNEDLYGYESTNEVYMHPKDKIFYLIGTFICSVLICYFVNEIHHSISTN